LAICLSLFGDLTLYTVLPSRREVAGLSLAAVGIMLGANRLIRIPGNPIIGAIFDRVGRRKLFLLGMTLAVLSTLGYGLLSGFVPFLITRLAWGLAWTLLNVGGIAMIHDISTPANRGRLSGAYNAWMLAGFAVGPLLGGFLVDLVGFRETMQLYAVITAVGWLVALLALPETYRPPRARETRGADRVRKRRTTDTIHMGLVQLRERVRQAPAVDRHLQAILLLVLLFQFAGEGIALSTFNLLLEHRFGATLRLGTLAIGVASATGILAALRSLIAAGAGPLAGLIADRRHNRSGVLAGSLVVGILGFGLLSVARSLPLILLGVIVSAISAGGGMAGLSAALGDRTVGHRRGLVVGAFATAGDIGSALGPLLAYTLAATVPVSWAYALCAVAFTGGLLFLGLTTGFGAGD
jgi:MFS family permease